MSLDGLFRFAIGHSLEIIICFDENGIITYANPSAEQQLEFEEGLCGHPIKEVFPGDFTVEDKLPDFKLRSGNHMKDMMAYRKNRTCFPAKGRLYLYE